MGRGDVAFHQEALVHVRFVAPSVDDQGTQFGAGPEQGGLIDDLAPRRVDEDGARLDLREEVVIGHPARGVVQGDMEGDDLRLRKQLVQGMETFVAFPFGPGRVAAQDLETEFPAGALHLPAHVADADDAQFRVLERNLLPCSHTVQGGEHIVAAGIASCRAVNFDPVRPAPGQVDMVRPDGGGRDHLHGRAFQQFRVAARPGTGNQYVGIQAVLPADFRAGFIDHLGIRFENTFQEGNMSVGDDLHGLSSSIQQR